MQRKFLEVQVVLMVVLVDLVLHRARRGGGRAARAHKQDRGERLQHFGEELRSDVGLLTKF